MLSAILSASPLLQSVSTVVSRPSAIVTLEASEAEMRDVADLHAQCFDQAWSADEILRLSRRPGASVHLARAEGRGRDRPLGFLILSQIADEAEIISIGVSPKARRRGVGDALVRLAQRNAQANRAERLLLEVDELNRGAVALYRRLGFHQVGERTAYYAHGDEPSSRALVMSLALR